MDVKQLIVFDKSGLTRSCSPSKQSPYSDLIRILIVKVNIELRKGIGLSQEITRPTINSNFRIQC